MSYNIGLTAQTQLRTLQEYHSSYEKDLKKGNDILEAIQRRLDGLRGGNQLQMRLQIDMWGREHQVLLSRWRDVSGLPTDEYGTLVRRLDECISTHAEVPPQILQEQFARSMTLYQFAASVMDKVINDALKLGNKVLEAMKTQTHHPDTR